MRGAAFLSVFETNKEGIPSTIKKRVIDLERGKRLKILLRRYWEGRAQVYSFRL